MHIRYPLEKMTFFFLFLFCQLPLPALRRGKKEKKSRKRKRKVGVDDNEEEKKEKEEKAFRGKSLASSGKKPQNTCIYIYFCSCQLFELYTEPSLRKLKESFSFFYE